MDREDLEVVDLGIASVETRGVFKDDPEPIGRALPGGAGISDD